MNQMNEESQSQEVLGELTNLLLDIGIENGSNQDDNDLDCCLAGGDSQSELRQVSNKEEDFELIGA